MLPSLAFHMCVGNLHADPQACKAGTVPTEPWPGSDLPFSLGLFLLPAA